MIILTYIIELFFRNCKHPERYAKWQENIFGDEINHLNCRSLWKAKWWPIPLRHNRLKTDLTCGECEFFEPDKLHCGLDPVNYGRTYSNTKACKAINDLVLWKLLH